MPRAKKKTEEEKEMDKLRKRSQRIEAERQRLNEPIIICRISDDEELYKTTEGEVIRGAEDYWWTIANRRPIHPEYAKLQRKPRFECPHCNFKTIYRISLANHMRYSHLPNHTESIYYDKLQDNKKEQEAWINAFKYTRYRIK